MTLNDLEPKNVIFAILGCDAHL